MKRIVDKYQWMVLATCVVLPTVAHGQDPKQAVIKRSAVHMRDPASFQAPLSLEPVKSVVMTCQGDGMVEAVLVKLGQSVSEQSEAIRLSSKIEALLLERAQAALKAAKANQEDHPSTTGGAGVEVAAIDVKIAEARMEHMTVKTPFTGMVIRIHVSPGQFVRLGDPLVTLIDPTKFKVEIPIDSRTVKVDSQVELRVEDVKTKAKVETIIPLTERFGALRNLFSSAATAVVTIDNSKKTFVAGQTVYCDMLPRQPVVEAPVGAVSHLADGAERRVQIIREGFVRDLKVQLLGQAGDDYVYVAGRFIPGDELIESSTVELADGSRVLPRSAPAPIAKDMPKPGTPGTPPSIPGVPVPAGTKPPPPSGF